MRRDNAVPKCSTGRRDFLKAAGMSAGLLAISPFSSSSLLWAKAEEVYPARNITMVVPYAVASGFDTWLRVLSPYISKYLKELSPMAKGGVIHMRNEPAAAGQRGYSVIFHSKPDGYTLGTFGGATTGLDMYMNPHGRREEVDFMKASFLLLGSTTEKILVTSKDGFKSWRDVLESLKKGPVRMSVGSASRFNHAAAVIMQEKMGLKFKLVVFPSSGDGINALIRGDVQLAMGDDDSLNTLIKNKDIRPLISFTETNVYPGASNIQELGFPELIQLFTGHRYLIAPPGLQMKQKQILLAAIKKASEDKEYIAKATTFGIHVAQVYGDDAEKDYKEFMKALGAQIPLLKKRFAE